MFFCLLIRITVDATFSVQDTTYSVSEGDETVKLCAVLVDGCLQREVEIEYLTFDGTALSTLPIYVSA